MKLKIKASILVVFLIVPGLKVLPQEEEIKDTPYFSGMPNFIIYDGADTEFDSYNFFNGKNCLSIEGKKLTRHYTIKEDAQKSSIIQITRNYANAIKSMGGVILYEGEPQDADCAENNGRHMVVGKVVKGGNELWVEIVPIGNEDYYMTLVIKESMRQDVTASDMFDALNRDGHIALYINFDTGKSEIRDESRSIIDQIVSMMKSNPNLKIAVEGHTDNVGSPSSNKVLSEARAKSVVAAIVGNGIDASRLTAAGYGQDKPVGDNSTEEGRAINRRVELVKK
jgi:outer membrane protein OmpA-like peptidoglycan-associated protein